MLNTSTTATHSSDIVVDKVSLRYGKGDSAVLALDGLSLNVGKEEFCVIVGPSGCGKSSLLYLIAGLEARTGGMIKVGERPVSDAGADRGMVFQAYTLFPWLTVRQNVEYGPRRKGMPTAERNRIVDHYLGEIGLSAFKDHYPSQLSGGMKQRVGLARALSMEPKILLLDEPFGALDALTRAHLQDAVMDIHARLGNTMIMITHDVDEAVLLSDRIVMMTNGPSARIGEVLDVPIARPRDRLALAADRTYLKSREAVLKFLYERHRFVEAAE